MGWANSGQGHKKTVSCPQEGCKYKSRHFVKTSFSSSNIKKMNKMSSHSKLCPIHQIELIYKPEDNGMDMKTIQEREKTQEEYLIFVSTKRKKHAKANILPKRH